MSRDFVQLIPEYQNIVNHSYHDTTDLYIEF